MAREIFRAVSSSETDDSPAEFVRAADRRIHYWPALTELQRARNEHFTVGLKLKLLAVGVALVCSEEELEPFLYRTLVRSADVRQMQNNVSHGGLLNEDSPHQDWYR
jgi:hypothetical protein